MRKAIYTSTHWSTTEWDCHKQSENDYAWDNEDGKLCTDNEATANLFRVLDELRKWNPNWVVNTTNAGYKSGYRTPSVNEEVGGVPNSFHTQGFAADIHISGQEDNPSALAQTVIDAAKSYGSIGLPDLLGIGEYSEGWVHVDTRGYTSRWYE